MLTISQPRIVRFSDRGDVNIRLPRFLATAVARWRKIARDEKIPFQD